MKTAAILCLLLASCAHTDLYHRGQRVARIQGDVRGLTITAKADGSYQVSCG